LEHKISLIDALNAGPIHFKTIEDEQIEISIDEVITPDTVKIIPGKGMPVLNNDPLGPIKRDYARGNLIVKFDIQFPNNLDE
jgi:DnaJ-class molecular chaperone